MELNLNFVWATFSKTHNWWLGQVSSLFLLACPLSSRDIFPAAGLRQGEARKSSRNLAPGSLSFCAPGSFVHNRYCLCELKLFVLSLEKGVTAGVRNMRRGFTCVACSLLITYTWHLNHSNKLCSPLWGHSNYSSLAATSNSYTAPYTLLFLSSSFPFYLQKMGRGWAALEILGSIIITGIHAFFFFFG